MSGYLEKRIQTPMAQGRSTHIISMIKWIRTSTLSIKSSLSKQCLLAAFVETAFSEVYGCTSLDAEIHIDLDGRNDLAACQTDVGSATRKIDRC